MPPKRKSPTRPILPDPRTKQQPRAQTARDLLRTTMITGNPIVALATMRPVHGKRGRGR
jgi:hypothetical protein